MKVPKVLDCYNILDTGAIYNLISHYSLKLIWHIITWTMTYCMISQKYKMANKQAGMFNFKSIKKEKEPFVLL